MFTLNGIDCVTKIDQNVADGLKTAGVEYVGRYLGDSWKSISKKEAETLICAGFKIVSIWETNPTKAAYFTKGQGIADGKEASAYANSIGQPTESAIYFAVDYDAQPADLSAILNYFHGVRLGLDKNYKVGVYGSYSVLVKLHQSKAAECYWQTAAWSRGKSALFFDIFQYGFNKKIAGIPVDYNQFSSSAGSWGHALKAPVSQPLSINTYMVQPGDTLSRIAARFGTPVSELVKANSIKDPNLIFAGQKLMIPATNIGNSERIDYTIISGDTLSQIAVKFGTTVTQLREWNRITNPDLILAGQKIRVK